MEHFPPLSPIAGVSVRSGHFWLREHVLGGRLRFQHDGGFVFGGDRVFERWDEPLGVRASVRSVREWFDASTFDAEVADPAAYTFYGVATRNEGLSYDWDRLPAFLGTNIRRPDGDLLPADVAHRAFDRLGLDPLNVFERELPARDFHVDRYAVPGSAWYDGPAAGTRVRRKNGPELLIEREAAGSDTEPLAPDEFVAQYVTSEQIDTTVATLGVDPSVDQVVDCLLARTVRRHYHEFDPTTAGSVRAAAVEQVARRR